MMPYDLDIGPIVPWPDCSAQQLDSERVSAVKLATGFTDILGIVQRNLTLAATFLYMMPMIIIFFVAQKNIIRGVVTTGLKG